MDDFYDNAEIRSPQDRERDIFARLPTFLAASMDAAPGLAEWLAGIDPATTASREALAALPVLHKADLMEMQKKNPPFGGFASEVALKGGRAFLSPGPIWEPQGFGADPWQSARAFHAAGIRPGDKIHNAFAYHMTPGGFILDEGARSLGCTVFPAGIGNTEMQVMAASAFRPDVYCGTPDYLKVMLDKAAETGTDLSSIKRALVSGGALFPSLRSEYAERGVSVLQCYATAEFGVIAYETVTEGKPNPGMVINEDLIVEIVRPGTGDPVEDGEVGEVVVTSFNMAYPMVRLATGDLSAVLPGVSPCGRTNTRIKGWMGRADQRTKVKGMFVDPKQIGALVKQHPEIARARLTVSRENERDEMVLSVELREGTAADTARIDASLREITKLRGKVEIVSLGSLPNDGKVIADEREYD
jgi:phenylacetate-CoA ligase